MQVRPTASNRSVNRRIDFRANRGRLVGWRRVMRSPDSANPRRKELPMSKGLDQKKSDKKKPEKTMKEKRAEKKEKKAAKGR
jgi:hypothetical protein